MKHRNRKSAGFTMVELAIALVIIGVITAYAIPNLLAAKRTSNEKGAGKDLATLSTNVVNYQAHQGVYPTLAASMGGSQTGTTVAAGCTTGDDEMTTVVATAWDAGFLKGGFNFKYLSGGTAATSPLGCAGNTLWEATAIPSSVDAGSNSYCADPTGEYQAVGIGTAASGAGCGTDGYTVAIQ